MQTSEVTDNSEAILKVLKKARELISEGWCRKVYWKKNGRECEWEEATHFCAVGSLIYVGSSSGGDIWYRAKSLLKKHLPQGQGYYGVEDFNDKTSKASVLKLYDKAIASLEKDNG